MKNLKPDLVYKGVQYIDLKDLKNKNIKGILLDIDNTLIDYTKTLSDEIVKWIDEAKAQGFKLCILSNSNKLEKITKVADKVELEYISFAKKPSKGGYIRAAKLLNLENQNIAMVGDQLFTDVLGANKVGMLSIYVEPINKKEYWYTKWKRPIESMILKHYLKKEN